MNHWPLIIIVKYVVHNDPIEEKLDNENDITMVSLASLPRPRCIVTNKDLKLLTLRGHFNWYQCGKPPIEEQNKTKCMHRHEWKKCNGNK